MRNSRIAPPTFRIHAQLTVKSVNHCVVYSRRSAVMANDSAYRRLVAGCTSAIDTFALCREAGHPPCAAIVAKPHGRRWHQRHPFRQMLRKFRTTNNFQRTGDGQCFRHKSTSRFSPLRHPRLILLSSAGRVHSADRVFYLITHAEDSGMQPLTR